MIKTGNITLTFCTVATFAAVGLATPAFAQETTTTTTTTTPAGEPVVHRNRTTTGGAGGLGVGAAAFVSGIAGPQVVYDFGLFHLEGLFGFDHREVGGGPNPPNRTVFELGVSGWYHLHMGDRSDFSVGGGFGMINASNPNSGTATVIEPGVQARVFVTDNVALHARLGVSFVFGDAVADPSGGAASPHIGLGGELMSAFGFTYFFR